MKTPATVAAVFALALPHVARAQSTPPTAFVAVSGGLQAGSRTLATSASFPLYDETAMVDATQSYGSEPLVDVGAGVVVWRRLGVGVNVDMASRTSTGTIVATIPSPFFFNRPATQAVAASGLRHQETAAHFQLLWRQPLSRRIDLVISAGPTVTRVRQDFAVVSVPAGTQNGIAASASATGIARGANVGADVSFRVARHYGIGAFVRDVSGTATIANPAAAGSTVSVAAGGLQFGAGLRFLFR